MNSAAVRPENYRSELATQNAKLLYVDDEPHNLHLFMANFSREFNIVTAISGEKALGILGIENDFACVISDQRMPGMSGTRLLAEVRTIAPQSIRMMLSGWSDTDVLMDAVNKGHIYRYILKPYDAEELRQCLRRAVEKYLLYRERDRLFESLEAKTAGLQQKTAELSEVNAALKTMLHQGTALREEMEQNVLASIEDLIAPLIRKLRASPLADLQYGYLDLIERRLEEIATPLARRLSDKRLRLSPIEKQIASLICAGNSSKEISDLLGLSYRTIETHRYRMRIKLGARDRRTRLQELLSSFFS